MNENSKNQNNEVLWGITAYFNPARYRNKYRNYLAFKKSVKKQGIKLIAVELEIDSDEFELKDEDADKVIKIRGNLEHQVWQKEALLNIGLKEIPENVKYVAWFDCDVIIKDEKWVGKAIKLLEKYDVVQLYSDAVRLKKGESPDSEINYFDYPVGPRDGERLHGIVKGTLQFGREVLNQCYEFHGHTGYAWAIRKSVIADLGFYDRNIIGAGDILMAYAFCGSKPNESSVILPSDSKFYDDWRYKIAQKIVNGVGYLPVLVVHIWHGDYKYRQDREGVSYMDYLINLEQDLVRDGNGIWRLSRNLFDKTDYFRYFFTNRNEEGKLMLSLKIIFRKIRRGKTYVMMVRKINVLFNRLLGRIGLIIKYVSPAIYNKLKLFKQFLS